MLLFSFTAGYIMKPYALSYLAVLLTYLVLDGIWLGLVAKESYLQSMQHVMREQFPLWPWAVFYLSYGFAILYLVILPNVSNGWAPVALSAAVLGMAAYGAYNLTCYALIQGWPLGISLKDWAWGIFITTASSLSGWWAYSKWQA